jgi:Bax protein
MKAKKNLQDLSYREKLLKLSRLYGIQEIQKKISNSRLTNKQIESLLKKNNVLLPKDLIDKKLNFIYWTNFYKVLAVAAIAIGFFGAVPLLYKSGNKINIENLAQKKQILIYQKKELSKKNIKPEENFYIPDEFELEDIDENTIRLGASTLNEIFKSANYDLDIIRKTKKVTPIYISVLPAEIGKIESTKEKKEIFIKIVLPLILRENEEIISDRKKLFRILGKIKNTRAEKKWLKFKLKQYRVKNSDLSELKIRMDIIPVSLAIAQAAKETGWGTSRFALEGNALFGQWTYAADGLKPEDAINGDHKVMRFNILQASVRAYKRNLNSHRVYKNFRSERAKLRERGEKINSLKLVKYLDKYAETGKLYTQILEKIIKQNSLMDFDQSKLLPTKSFIKSNI